MTEQNESLCDCCQCRLSPEEKVEILREALQTLVDRRREVAARQGHLTGQSFEGSDGRYAKAQHALDITK